MQHPVTIQITLQCNRLLSLLVALQSLRMSVDLLLDEMKAHGEKLEALGAPVGGHVAVEDVVTVVGELVPCLATAARYAQDMSLA